MKNNIRSWLIGLLIAGSVSLNFNLKVLIPSVNLVSDAAAESVQGEEAKLASSLFRPSTTRSAEAWGHSAADRLPAQLETTHQSLGRGVNPFWNVESIVEVSRIESIAISKDGNHIAFIVQRSFLDSATTRYGLYVVERAKPGRAKKLVESEYISEVQSSDSSGNWTIRTDVGNGVQLYNVNAQGSLTSLVVNSTIAITGPWEGVVGGLGSPQRVGVLSYQWAPDRSALWYSRLRLRSPEELARLTDHGIVYDDLTMSRQVFRSYPGTLLGTELRIFTPSSGSDRVIAFVPTDSSTNLGLFSHRWGTASWELDSQHVRYSVMLIQNDGGYKSELRSVDVITGETTILPDEFADQGIIPPDGRTGSLVLRHERTGYRLYELLSDGRTASDLGAVSFQQVTGSFRVSPAGEGIARVVSVRFPERDGLVVIENKNRVRSLVNSTDNLSLCAFTETSAWGACVRESITQAPEIVAVSSTTGEMHTLARPNARYDSLKPLRSEYEHWTNKFGYSSDGFVTYPRNYTPRRKYPAIVITHGNDARNRFLAEDLQWHFPLQLFAEQGYFVLSINEPVGDEERGHLHQSQQNFDNVERVQFGVGLNAVAMMESAAQSFVEKGMVDQDRIGIAGYSRGAEVTLYAMTHSKVFKAASIGDGGLNEDSYWTAGTKFVRRWQTSIYGGSPYDSNPRVSENYRRFSPSFRSAQFAGPLLQEFSAGNAPIALEMNRLLKDQKVPVELVFYPDEAHVFWHPRHKAAVLQRNLDWFNYWLLNSSDLNAGRNEQYQRWAVLSQKWKTNRSARN